MRETTTTTIKRLWVVFGVAIFVAFFILGWFGREVYRKAPPIPERVVTESGRTLFEREDILTGQQVWQSIGGQQVGSIWGHGAYQAPDWTADWLHREATALQGLLAEQSYAAAYPDLDRSRQARSMRKFRPSCAPTHTPTTAR
jgi:nitric oxide reductase subunit B